MVAPVPFRSWPQLLVHVPTVTVIVVLPALRALVPANTTTKTPAT
jgi:hypothetical protein